MKPKIIVLAVIFVAGVICGRLSLPRSTEIDDAAGRQPRVLAKAGKRHNPGRPPADSGSRRIDPAVDEEDIHQKRIKDKLKTIQLTQNLQFLSDRNGTSISPQFAELFELNQNQLALGEEALRTAMQAVTKIETETVVNVTETNGVVTFEIPYFGERGGSIKQVLRDRLSSAIGPAATDYIFQHEMQMLLYQFGGFGAFRREFTLKPLTDDPNGNLWELQERHHARNADWAVKEGKSETYMGNTMHRFKDIPDRFKTLVHKS